MVKQRTLHRFAHVAGVAVACAVVGSCEKSPTAPKPSVQQIVLGSVANGSLAAADSARIYTFGASGGSAYTVFVKLLDLSRVRVDLEDSAQSTTIASVVMGPTDFPLDQNAAIAFTAPSSGTFALAVRPYPAGQAAHFQLEVLAVAETPESRAAAFAIGDTVSGESLSPVGDVDVFAAHVASAQDIVIVVAAPDSTGLGMLRMTVSDSAGGPALVSWYYPTGVPASLTSGRIHLPAAGTYRFRLEDSSATALGAFHGSYRFWTYAVNHAPERASATAAAGTVMAGESIDRPGDVDEFTFAAQTGQEINAFFQCPATAHLEILSDSGAPLGTVSAGPDPNLYTKFTGRVALPRTGTYTVRVTSDGFTLADTGAYRFYLYPINRQPEAVSATVTPGDSVMSEAIDLPGDVDELTLAGAPGQQFYAFLQARSGKANSILEVDAVDAGGATLGTMQSHGTDTTLLGHVPATFTMPASGSVRLRVWGAPGPASGSYGPYRLFAWALDAKPEARADTLAFVDSVLTQAIDVPGDVDEYRFHVRDASGVNLVTSFLGGSFSSAVLHSEIVDSIGGAVVAATDSWGSGLTQTAAVAIKPGAYILRVRASTGVGSPFLRGPYRVWLYGFRYGPESVRDTIAIGDTIQGESLDVPGDVDTYHFYGQRGQHVNVMLQGLAAAGNGGFGAYLSGPSGPELFGVLSSPLFAAVLTDHQTLRLDLPATGWYTVAVSGASTPPSLAEHGPYRLAVVPVGTTPERVSSTLAVGDSLTTESLDFLGDWDQYTVHATPGQEVNILFGKPTSDAYPSLALLDSVTGLPVTTFAGYGPRLLGPVRVPSSGTIALAAFEQPSVSFRWCLDATCGGVFSFTGPYPLQVRALNRAPESVPAAYTLGDTVRGEAIWPTGDIDEFSLTANPGDTLTPWFRLRALTVPASQAIGLEVTDPANGAVLLPEIGLGFNGIDTSFYSPGTFVVPASGRVLIRFKAAGSATFDENRATAPYEFFVKKGT